jgi:hypothetical protein
MSKRKTETIQMEFMSSGTPPKPVTMKPLICPHCGKKITGVEYRQFSLISLVGCDKCLKVIGAINTPTQQS